MTRREPTPRVTAVQGVFMPDGPLPIRVGLGNADGWSVEVVVRAPDGSPATFDFYDQDRETADVAVRIEIPERGYVVDVHVIRDRAAGTYRAAGTMARTVNGGPVSARELRRLPFARCIATALAAARWIHEHWISETPVARTSRRQVHAPWATSPRLPPGHPPRGKTGVAWYLEFANAYRAAHARGERPSQTIAKHYDVKPNLVYQWKHQACKLGFLDPPVRRRPDAAQVD